MSRQFASLLSTSDNTYFQGVWSRMFGAFIESARRKAGLSVDQAAALAGMDAQRWSAIEAGAWLPTTRQQLHLIAAALDLDWATMAQIVLMCRQAWGLK
jgi:transcriptional regulator with XRE-family HTH domain